MKKCKKFKTGSQVFFSQYSDYTSHDKDFVEFQENPELYKTFMNVRGKGNDIYYFRLMPKQDFIEYELNHCSHLPMAAIKFLSPEIIEFMNITIDDLKLFQSIFENIDERHKYAKIIYDAYIKNNAFILTDEQRNEAYKLYKENKNY